MPNLNAIIDASKDPDLLERIAAAAGVVGCPNPEQFARQYAQSVVSQPQKAKQTDTLADAHAYKKKTMPAPPLRPGQDPAAVTDDMIMDAVKTVWDKLQTPPPTNPTQPPATPPKAG